MIQRVYEQASKSGLLSHVVVATDNQQIYDHVNTFGKAIITSAELPSGTDRCFEAAKALQKEGFVIEPQDVIINIQGDEPFIDPGQIDQLAMSFSNSKVNLATLVKKITDEQQINNPNVVKVVRDVNGRALYFSRYPVPYIREAGQLVDKMTPTRFKHIGMYAYRLQVLEQIAGLAQSSLELSESLEQLRWLENGIPIHTIVTHLETFGVDTPEDLKRFEK